VTRSEIAREARDLLEEHRQREVARVVDELLLDEQIASVADHAGLVWKEAALRELRALAETRQHFTVEHLSPRVPATTDLRALGAILREGAKRGWIIAEGWTPGDRTRHGRPVRVWRSTS
jgi:hypothetical protein